MAKKLRSTLKGFLRKSEVVKEKASPSIEEISKPVTINSPTHSRKNKLSEVDLKNPFVSTDFDKILHAINSAGIISAAKLRKDLNMDGARLRECYLTLEKAGSLRVEYPLFGPPKLISTEFERAKKRKEMIKMGEQVSDEDLNKAFSK